MSQPNFHNTNAFCRGLIAFGVVFLVWVGISPSYIAGQKKDDTFNLKVPVELVIVPVTVEDKDGNLISGLTKDDFELYVEGSPQAITYFSSDPIPLSVAILIDKSMESTSLSTIKNTLTSLVESFSPFDEIAIFQFENTSYKIQDFTFNKEEVLAALRKLSFASASGSTFGEGPFSGSAGTGDTKINGVVIDSAQGRVPPPKTLNTHIHDAIFNTAMELRRRSKERRGIIVIISNGQDAPGNRVSYDEAIAAVVRSEIQIYGIAQGTSLFYRKLNILNKYANASGGEVFFPVKNESLSDSYQKIGQMARNKYVLGFVPHGNVKEPTFQKLTVRIRTKDSKAEDTRYRKGFYLMPR
jgi:VWFA-related protein